MIRIASLALAPLLMISDDAVLVKNRKTGEAISLSFPALQDAPLAGAYEQQDKFPEILTARIVVHNGKKFMCGLAKGVSGYSGARRYVISMEMDWQIWEPSTDDRTWRGWNDTFDEICGSTEG